MSTPTAPIELDGGDSRWGDPAAVPPTLIAQLSRHADVVVDRLQVAEASRDWWPLALHWSLDGEVPRRAAVVVRPHSVEDVAAVVAACHGHSVPVTTAGGRSGVNGGSVPVFGGVLLDLSELQGVVAIDVVSGLVEVLAGTFGPDLESALRAAGLTCGHFPQSFDLATVGGWVACLGAGQFSTRYGKIDAMVAGLEIVLADGTVVRSGVQPAGAHGPELDRLFIGSEGTLGVITRVWLRCRPLPASNASAAYWFTDFPTGIEACRQILRRGATPAVLRLYDGPESQRSHGGDGTRCALLVHDEADEALLAATMTVVADVCTRVGATGADAGLVDGWMAHRNDTNALQALTRKGFVVDTMEVAAPWAALPDVFERTCAALAAVPTCRAATCHLSHSYVDGACLYFTFAATPAPGDVEAAYIALWDAGQRAALAAGANLSHHHGVGLNRSRFMAEADTSTLPVLQAVKDALDPRGILNPGKLGLRSPFGSVPWP